MYKKINKAFAHIIFFPEELKELGIELEFTNKLYYPLSFYNNLIKNSGLYEVQTEIDNQEVESFFNSNPLVRQRILSAFKLEEWTVKSPAFQMSQCFVDFILRK